ncbi:RagB/SusD family nutrient uptake outer membrane protein [Pedobacter glucosidilyticus]|uniref:RagB/SusD family nutrient uptake outer membrane protein n=1 Tax=Pedobacter glucosidilyticus TaxID=1122941 RepID=UPI00040B44A3|nr:RagB/SusD family nutrient uptake outer membrane protein [Pedobacter glucosidilyticus]
MNQLIKYNVVAMGVVVLSLLSSCKDYLKIDNPSTISETVAFGSLNEANSTVVGVYAKLPGDNGYGSRLSLSFSQGADDFKVDGAYNPLQTRGLSHYGASPNLPDLKAPYEQLYSGIERANMCIKYIPLSPIYNSGTETEKVGMRKLLGEALTLRAQFYLELLRNWGDLPARFVPASDITDQYIGKEDRDVIYDRLLEDLREAATLVPWRSQTSDNTPTRITKGVVKGLRARIALTRGGYSLRRNPQVMARKDDYLTYYTIARDECKEIIESGEHGLNPNFENLFKSLHTSKSVEVGREMMFTVGAAGTTGATNTKMAYSNGIRQNASSSYGQANGLNAAIATYFYEFDREDLRRDVTLAYYSISATNTKELTTSLVMREGKFRKYWTAIRDASQNLGVNWAILRYADILLMYAEAENELSGPENAKSALRQVRERAFPQSQWPTQVTNYINTVSANKETFFNAIMQERLLEFGGEGIRKYDLIRWNKLASNIEETRQKMRDFRDGVGVYANYPRYVYYIPSPFINAATIPGELANLNLFGGNINTVMYTPGLGTSTAPAGYTTVRWRDAVNDTGNSERFITGVDGIAHAFVPNSRELLPIHSDIIGANFRLTQDYGY